MTHLHFDCFSGIGGDMVLGALVDAGLPLTDLARGLKALPADGYRLRARPVRRAGLHATKVDVVVARGYREPLSLRRILRLIGTSRLPAPVKDRARETFERLARAEGLAHRVAAEDVRFHEVGVIDSLVDVVGGILGCHLLGVGRITASAVNLGGGLMESSHGTLPVPGPAVAALARGLPVYSGGPSRELTTPTGLALLRVLAGGFGPLPVMTPSAVGHGAGDADPEGWPNVLRVFIGEAASAGRSDRVVEVETNLDDLSPQAYDLVMDRLFAAGALDVTLTPVIMKQGRPGIVLAALAPPARTEAVADVILKETTSLGVRVREVDRLVLPRRSVSLRTKLGPVRLKVADLGDGRVKAAPEYQDCRRLAERTGRPLRDVMEAAMLAFSKTRSK
ncbi:MAG TPA: nickel pincer cofactor biosynthesis protein LarC [Gemmataceae bacterium]|nr:nickel pincer cofactor biosynthesis protein LarC [Gemmataceae bacterium]